MNPELLNKVHQGDSLEIMATMPDECIDMVCSDPPYGIDFVPQRGTFEAIENDKRDTAQILWEKFVPEICRLMKKDSYAFLSIGWTELDWVLPVLRKNFEVKSCIVWYKNQFGIGYYTRPQHEFNLLCLKGKPKPPEKAPSDVWEMKKVHDLQHSCQKPEEWSDKAISLYSPEGGVILDPFIGSGTTAVSAKKLGRKYVGMELKEEFVAIANERLRQDYLFG